MGSGTASSEMPCFSTLSRNWVRPSTDHFSSNFREGSSEQIFTTPKAEQALRVSSSVECWVPTFIRTGFLLTAAEAAGENVDWRAAAVTGTAAADWRKLRRFIIPTGFENLWPDGGWRY